jgi:hypothetical protein
MAAKIDNTALNAGWMIPLIRTIFFIPAAS